MKVLLINPPMRNLFHIFTPSFVPENWGVYPPLGLLYVAAYLQNNSNHEVQILDTQVDKLDDNQIKSEIMRLRPDVVGIQAWTFTFVDCLKTAQIVKEIDGGIPVVLGGRHIDHYPQETMSLPYVDVLVQGEADISFTRLINVWGNVAEMKKIPGLVFRHGKEIIETGPPEPVSNLDQLPFPARALVPVERYMSVVQKRNKMTTMITSRGCPFRCTFCDENLIKFRQMSAERVLNEIEECVKMGINEFFFFDDTFTVNEKRINTICDGIMERKLDIVWDVRAHINSVTVPILEKMRAAGCDRIQFGVESGDEMMMKIIRKGIDLERTKKIFAVAGKLGFTTYADFMLGLPSETKEQMEKTFRLALEIDPDFCQFSIFVPFPGTALFELGLQKELYASDHWRNFARDPFKNFVPFVWTELYSKDELMAIRDKSYERFYFRLSYMLRSLRRCRSLSEFARKAKAGLSMMSYYVRKKKPALA